MNRCVARWALGAFVLMGVDATAQTVRADRFTLNTGPCTERSGSGSPESAVTGIVCDTYHRTDSPFDIYRKISGSGNTGWKSDTITGTVGTVTSVSVTTANGVSGSVATSTTTPAITLTLGAITPSSVASTGAISVDGTAFAVADTTGAISTTAVAALTTAAESWVGPSTTAGVYFKGGSIGLGTTTPGTINGNLFSTQLHVKSSGLLGTIFDGTSSQFILNASSNSANQRIVGWFNSSVYLGKIGLIGLTDVGNIAQIFLVGDLSNGNVGIGDSTPDYLLDVAGTFGVDGVTTLGAPARLMSYTVATLPAGVQGYVAYVTDALAPTFMATVVGGGAVVCVVFYNGTNWVAF